MTTTITDLNFLGQLAQTVEGWLDTIAADQSVTDVVGATVLATLETLSSDVATQRALARLGVLVGS